MSRVGLWLVALLALGGVLAVYDLVNRPLPEHAGIVDVEGLVAPVEVLRDERGVPHIFAENLYDVFFTQGYVQAQDRWWQMEFWRHTASGRLCELVGRNESALQADGFLRTLGWRHVAEAEAQAMDEVSRGWLEAFCDGVNAYIGGRSPAELALEYRILGLTGIRAEVEPWAVEDTLVFAKLMAWDMGLEECKEVLRAALYERIGPVMTDAWLTPPWPYDRRPTIVQPEDLPPTPSAAFQWMPLTAASAGAAAHDVQVRDVISASLGTGPGGGTNAWVVSGAWTSSGHPLLANDTHLGIQMPTVWYEIGLHCDEGVDPALDVVGFAFPAAPGVVVGHNRRIAWGISNAYPDVHDTYTLRINPENPLQYEWNGFWRDMTMREETIRFADGSEPLVLRVRETHLGPITTDNRYDAATGAFSGFENKAPLARRWTALEPGTVSQAVLSLNQAEDWCEFRESLRNWDVPAQHFVYADVDGNIGYQLAGRIPIRAADHDGLVPTIGWTSDHAWQGFLPFDRLPGVLNPAGGMIVAANHAPVPLDYYAFLAETLGEGANYQISREMDFGYRAQRVVELLHAGAPHTVDSFLTIQGDTMLLSSGEILPFIANLEVKDDPLAEARDWLLEWDGLFDRSSARAVFYAHLWGCLVRNIFADELGGVRDLVGGDREMWAVCRLLEAPDDPWWDDVTTENRREARDEILERSLAEAWTVAIHRYGADRTAWSWGALHGAVFISKPLGQSGIGLFERIVNRGPVPVGGMTDTVCNTRWSISLDSFDVKSIPAMRMVIDLGDLNASVGLHSTGQSGHPFSSDYDSMIPTWQTIGAFPMLWTREAIETASARRVILHPRE